MGDDAITPRNRAHFIRLMDFASDVLAVCAASGVAPILDGSLAVWAYTRDPAMEVHDVDLSCSEADFPRLFQSLRARGIRCEIRSWHVLQARRDNLKVEFGATEYWMRDVTHETHTVRIAGITFRAVGPEVLRELYHRGLAATALDGTDPDDAKHHRIAEKLHALDALHP